MTLQAEEQNALYHTLKARFESNMPRHLGMNWADIQAKLDRSPDKVSALWQMEKTGGEPDVIEYDAHTGEYHFYDCSPQSPTGRRNTCYDGVAQRARKANAPEQNAIEMADAMGITLLTPDQYRRLQSVGAVDTTTSSWLLTPPDIRQLGGALFGDYRYGTVFIYHNGVQSYYAARGFRGILKV